MRCNIPTAFIKILCIPLQDMAPYVPLLVPELRTALVDPLPEVRATAARALGSLLRGMGQEHFEDLVPWLLQTLKSEVRTDRIVIWSTDETIGPRWMPACVG